MYQIDHLCYEQDNYLQLLKHSHSKLRVSHYLSLNNLSLDRTVKDSFLVHLLNWPRKSQPCVYLIKDKLFLCCYLES